MTLDKPNVLRHFTNWIPVVLLLGGLWGMDQYLSRNMLETTARKAPLFNLMQVDASARLTTQFPMKKLVGKPTIVYFFAPWCSICHLSISNLQALYEEQGEQVNVIAIALSYESIDQVREFMEDKTLTMPVLLGTGMVATEYKIDAFPSYYVMDAEFKIVARSRGYSTEVGMKMRLMELL